MRDGSDKSAAESPDDTEPGPLCGQRLAAARRAQQIAAIEIAKELHLDEYKVRALERNDFNVIGAPVFAKGHLRKYAQLVQVSQDDVMADYYQLERSTAAPPVLSTRRRPRREITPGPWIAAIIVIVLAATAYWWFVTNDSGANTPLLNEASPPSQNATQVAEQTGDASDTAAESIVDQEVGETVDDDIAVTRETPAEQPAPIVPAQTTPLETGQLRLSLTYTGDCWTEITDANGRRLFFDLGSSGRTVNLSGEAPFNVLFGDAANVSLEVNGAPFEISAADRRGRTAKLTITGS